jgi:hypothetical protein
MRITYLSLGPTGRLQRDLIGPGSRKRHLVRLEMPLEDLAEACSKGACHYVKVSQRTGFTSQMLEWPEGGTLRVPCLNAPLSTDKYKMVMLDAISTTMKPSKATDAWVRAFPRQPTISQGDADAAREVQRQVVNGLDSLGYLKRTATKRKVREVDEATSSTAQCRKE